MNKNELVVALAAKTGLTQAASARAIDGLIDVIYETTAAGDSVRLVGFGNFEVAERKARNGRNPKTGKSMELPATRVPRFSAGATFKAKVKG